MLILVDPHSGVPVYRQLMDQIKFHIATGLVTPGDELPSTRALSAEVGINPMTISKAYGFLEREGIVERRPGKPLVVGSLDARQLEEQRSGQVRDHLAPTATMVRQLGFDVEEAIAIFSRLLRDSGEPTSGPEESKK